MKRSLRGLYFCTIALLLFPLVAYGRQMPTGAIIGTVTDASGAVLPGVTLSLSGERLIGGTQVQTTTAAGEYRFDGLPPGSYQLTCELSGFKTVQRSGIVVNAAFTATVDIKLEVGALEETVTVSGGSPVVDTKSTLQQTVLDQDVLEKIPTGRDPWSLSQLIPGVQVAQYDVGGTNGIQQSRMTVHGSTTGEVVYAVDGLNTNWPGGDGGATSSYYDQGMFEEINYATSAIPAEQAVGGAFINMVSKEGGNQLRGSAAVFFSNDSLQDENFDTPALRQWGFEGGNPVTKLHDVSFSLGGPVVRDRLWWFAAAKSFELDRLTLGALNPDGTPASDPNNQQTYTGKATAQLAQGHRLNYLWSVNFNNRKHRRDVPPAFVTDRAATYATARHVTQGPRYSAVLGGTIVFESALMKRAGTGSFGYQPGTPASAIRVEDPLRNTADIAAPGYLLRPNGRTQFNNTLTFFEPDFYGSHRIKTGIQWAKQSFETQDFHNGDLTAIFHDGVPNSVRIYNTPTHAISYTRQVGFFVQDDWSIGSRLTLNVGGRFDTVRGWTPELDVPAGRFIGARHFDRKDVLSQSIAVWRSGMVFDLFGDGRTALKGNYSRYGSQVGIERVNAVNPGANSSGVRAWTDHNGDGIPQDSELGPFAGFGGGASSRYADSDGPDWPYSDEITIGLEHELLSDFRVSAMYYHRINRKQVGRRNVAVPSTAYTRETVQVPAQPLGPGGSATFFNLDPAFFGLQDNVLDNERLLDTSYHGVEFTATKRFSNRWQLAGGVTIGRNRGGQDYGDLNDPNNLLHQEGVVGNDSTYSLKFSGSYLAPGEVMLGGALLWTQGYPYQSTYLVTRQVFGSLTRANQTVRLSDPGEERYPDVRLLSLRVSRPFTISRIGTFEPLIEVFNLMNSGTVVTLTRNVGSRYLAPSEILGPRLVRIGFRVEF